MLRGTGDSFWATRKLMQSGMEAGAHMLKQPGHFTSMKKELGVCTKRFSLCRRCSSSRGGCRRSMSPIEMCACHEKVRRRQPL